MDKTAKKIIEDAINNPEFIARLAKGFDFLPCIRKIVECEDGIFLESLKSVLEDRINQLNIQYWFERIEETFNRIENRKKMEKRMEKLFAAKRELQDEQIKEIGKLWDIQRELKDYGVEVVYHGLKDLNDDGYPYFVQWGHKLPVLTIGNGHGTKFLELPLEIAFAIEKMLGNVGSEHDFKLQIYNGVIKYKNMRR